MIRVLHLYRNISGARIPAADYADNDPVLQGLGQYLIDNGHAVRLAVVEQPEAAAQSPADDAPDPAAIVRAHLEVNPADISATAAAVAKKLKVAREIVAEVQAEFVSGKPTEPGA